MTKDSVTDSTRHGKQNRNVSRCRVKSKEFCRDIFVKAHVSYFRNRSISQSKKSLTASKAAMRSSWIFESAHTGRVRRVEPVPLEINTCGKLVITESDETSGRLDPSYMRRDWIKLEAGHRSTEFRSWLHQQKNKLWIPFRWRRVMATC